MDLGTLRFLNPRETFPTEPVHFSKWVADNLDRLGDMLGLELELLKREAEVGSFSLDILARVVGTDDLVIIENQIEPTDHRHLGQILTYASGLDARHIVWISPTFREEHRAALDWLNVNTIATRHFFGIQVEVLRRLQAGGQLPNCGLAEPVAKKHFADSQEHRSCARSRATQCGF